MPRASISLYLLAGFLLLLALPIAVGGSWQADQLKREATDAAEKELNHAAVSLGRSVEDVVLGYRSVAEALAAQAEEQPRALQSAPWMQTVLGAFHRGHNETRVLLFADAAGTVIEADPPRAESGREVKGMSYVDRVWYQEVKRTLKTATGQVTHSKVRASEVNLAVAAPIRDGAGAWTGIAVVSFEFTRVTRMVERLTTSLPDSVIVLLDGDGRVLVHSDPQFHALLGKHPPVELYAPAGEGISMRSGPDEHGVLMHAAVAPFTRGGVNWRLVLMRPEASIHHRVEQLRQNSLRLAFAVALGGLLFSLMAFLFIARPMRQLSQLAKAIGAGDLSSPVPRLRWWFPRETAGLLRSMAKMQQELRGSMERFSSLHESLETARHNIQNLGASSGAHPLEAVLRSAQELQDASLQAGADAESVLAVATRAQNARKAGAEAMASTFEQLGKIQERFAAVVDVTRTLEVQLANIVSINGMIDGIAGRSDILSINAAIEAMRAGEAGAGFSQIAKAIRELSSSSQKSGEEITVTLQQVQVELRRASEQSHRGKTQLEHGLSRLRESGQKLETLANTVEASAQAVQNVAHSVSAQRSAVERIGENLTALQDATNRLGERGMRSDRVAEQMSEIGAQLAKFLVRFRA